MRSVLLSIGIAFCAFNSVAFGLFNPAEILTRGDANNDTQVDGADSLYINQYLFNGGSVPPCMDAADVNDDGTVDVSDVSYLNTYLFQGGPAPPPPFPCGRDTTSDSLGCDMSACPQ